MSTTPRARHARAPSVSMTDAFEAQNFNPIAFVNDVIPDERALAGVEKMIEKLRQRVKLVDAEIMGSLRAQSGSEARARDDFEVIVGGVDGLNANGAWKRRNGKRRRRRRACERFVRTSFD